MRNILVFILFLSFLSVACSDNEHYRNILDRADAVMESSPDSALSILAEIDDTIVLLSDDDKALYFLLLTQAQFKCYEPTPFSDRLDFSINHYDASGEKEYLSRAFYYRGVSQYEAHEYDAAINNLKRGETIAESLGDDELLSKYYESLYGVNHDAGYNEMSLKYARLFLALAEKMRNYDYMARANTHIAAFCEHNNDKEGAIKCINNCISFIDSLNNYSKSLILVNIAGIYFNQGNMEKAADYVEQSLELYEFPEAFHILAHIYIKQGKDVEGSKYIQWALYNADVNLRRSILNNLMKLSVQQDNYKDAYRYSKELRQLTDSIASTTNNAQIVELQLKYDKSVIESSHYKRITYFLAILIILIIVICVIIYVYKRKVKLFSILIASKDDEISTISIENKFLEQDVKIYEKDIITLQKRITDMKVDVFDRLMRGRDVYEVVARKGKLPANIPEADRCLVEYFEIFYSDKYSVWKNKYTNMTKSKVVLLILSDMGYTDKEIASILSLSESSIRSRRTRLNSGKKIL